MKKILLAEKAGFCTGVARAMKMLLTESERKGPGSTLGPLVHNEEVVNYLQANSINEVSEPENAEGKYLAIRTHGISPELLERLKKLENIELIDLTCTRVKHVQKIAADLQGKDYNIYIFGNKNHPEVIGLLGWAGDKAVVFSDPEEIKSMVIDEPAALIAQTTADEDEYKKAAKILEGKVPEAIVFQTLCPETRLRREAAAELAERVDAFIVIGSKTSANTQALYNRCRQLKPTCRINSIRELDRSFLEQFKVVGVTAGASTPPWTIKEAVESMENEKMETQEELQEDLQEEVKIEEVESGGLQQEEEAQTKETSAEEQFQFDADVMIAQVGEQVTGKVARITDDEVYVDIGAKSEAVLPAGEVYLPEGKVLTDLFAPEDDIEVTVFDINEQDGKVSVSHKRLAREKRMKTLEETLEQDQVMQAPVKQVVGAGMVIDLGNGIEGFMPGSLVDTRYIPDFNEFKGKDISFKIIELDRDKGKLILSRKKIVEEETEKAKEETLKAIEVDSTIKGTVKRLTDFGAFVDIGGIDGLVHISELSWERVNHPSEVIKVGDEIEVKVLEVIPEKERISLSIRKTQPDPWTKAVEDIESGEVIKGKVTRLVNFGAFIEIKPGVEGLAHISQLADFHVNHPSEVLAEGEEVEVKVIEVKAKSKRISLSVKEAGGISVSQSDSLVEGSENGNVTLGDVFGDLFDKEEFQAVDDQAEDDDLSEEKAEEGQE